MKAPICLLTGTLKAPVTINSVKTLLKQVLLLKVFIAVGNLFHFWTLFKIKDLLLHFVFVFFFYNNLICSLVLSSVMATRKRFNIFGCFPLSYIFLQLHLANFWDKQFGWQDTILYEKINGVVKFLTKITNFYSRVNLSVYAVYVFHCKSLKEYALRTIGLLDFKFCILSQLY